MGSIVHVMSLAHKLDGFYDHGLQAKNRQFTELALSEA